MCKHPFKAGTASYGCGQCLPCRINRRRLWTHRLMLEERSHERSSFLTLTYADHATSLEPRHTTLWLKRLRKEFGPLRYYLVGEYGDESFRPHYHAAIFGIGLDPTQQRMHVQGYYRCACTWCSTMKRLWRYGKVDTGNLTFQSAAYIAGYVTKKMTKRDDPRLNGREPEFARMSLRPGIGALALCDVAASLSSVPAEAIGRNNYGDVPVVLQHGKKKLPLGRYLRGRLRDEMGSEFTSAKEVAQERRYQEVRALSFSDGTVSAVASLKRDPEEVKILQVETKHKIWSKKGNLT